MLRFLILALTVVSLSGCTDTSYDDSTVIQRGLSRVYHDDGRTILAEDQYYNSGFTATSTFRLDISVNVQSGPSIDVIVLDELNFNQFRDGNGYVHFSGCGGVAAQAYQRSCTLGADTYYIVIDNSDRGDASPPWNGIDDGADVTWDFAAYA